MTTGCKAGLYCPFGAVRRDEMATFLTRADPNLFANPPPPPTRVPVASITDGDTIRVIVSVVNEPLRLIGIDTPERGQLCFNEATDAMKALVAGRTVRIGLDVSNRDRFDRLLRYVFLTDGSFVNAERVRRGWAATTEFPTRHTMGVPFRPSRRPSQSRRPRYRGCQLCQPGPTATSV